MAVTMERVRSAVANALKAPGGARLTLGWRLLI